MADEDLRELERAWRASPQDGELAGRLVTALRRAGRPAPLAALEARRLPSRTLRTRDPLEVNVWRPVDVGGAWCVTTPVDLGVHSGWEARVRASAGPKVLERLAADLVALEVEGLVLSGVEPTHDPAPVVRFLEALRGAPLARLRVDLWRTLPGPVLAAALSHPALVELDLRLEAGVELLRGASALERLSLALGEGVTDADLAVLGALPALRELRVWSTGPGAAAARFLEAFPAGAQLRALVLFGCSAADDETLRVAARLASLDQLHLPISRGVTAAGVGHLQGRALGWLSLGGPALGDDGLRALGATAVTGLSVEAPGATPEGWGALPATLEQLSLRDAPPFDLGALSRLQALVLHGAGLQGWFERLPAAPRLSRLHLELDEEETVDLAPLSRLPALQELTLTDLGVGPEALAALQGAGGLRRVALDGGRWGDEHVLALQALPHLEELALQETSTVTDAALRALSAWTGLRQLTLGPVRGLTRDGVERLRRARPDLRIDVLGELEEPRPGLLARFLGLFRAS